MSFLKEHGKKVFWGAVTLALAMVLLNQIRAHVPGAAKVIDAA